MIFGGKKTFTGTYAAFGGGRDASHITKAVPHLGPFAHSSQWTVRVAAAGAFVSAISHWN